MKTINLTQGKLAIVDDEDLERVNQFKWFLSSNKYAVRNKNIVSYKKRSLISLHRFIMGLKKGDKRQIDHINHDILDNRKENLRICLHSENQKNRKINRNNPNGFKGVSSSNKKWVARIIFDGKRIYLGSFISKNEAAKAYNFAAKNYFGEFACFNKI